MLSLVVWNKFKSWCKERWELIAGFFVGVFTLLFFLRKDNAKDIIDKKNDVQSDISKSETEAREKLEEEWNSNIEDFVSRNNKIEDEHKKKLLEIDDDKKDRVKELMSSDQPEEDIAQALAELLK